MHICLVYDCLFPHTIGGAERWYRRLAEQLAAEGHEVTYLTMRQWDRGEDPDFAGVRVVAVAPRMKLYAGGRRRLAPPLVFGAGVLGHLLRHGDDYDVVHTCAFPYFSVLAAAAARRRHGFRLAVDWFEVWTRAYWREYLGPAGWFGWKIQSACARVRQQAFCFSRLHAGRLSEIGLRSEPVHLAGLYAGSDEEGGEEVAAKQGDTPRVVFAGRHIPEKHAPAVVDSIAEARVHVPGLQGEILGDGPERAEVLRRIAAHGLADAIGAPGFVPSQGVEAALRRASCLVLPSQREGYGLVVIEAAAVGTPSVVVANPDNAATELISEGENGYVAASISASDLAAAITRVVNDGPELRRSTASWFERNLDLLSAARSAQRVARIYEEWTSEARRPVIGR